MQASKLVIVGVFAIVTLISEGSSFLKAPPQHATGRVSQQDVQNSLLEEIEGSLGTGIAARRIADMKAILGPMFVSLPKNEHANLEHATVRYVLHRVFVQRHGWSIKGLNAAGEAWNSSSPMGMLKDQVPAFVQNLFEQRLGGRGLGLHELAVFAATIEHLVHNEAIGRLGSALNVHNLLPTAMLSASVADEVLDTYMMAYILGEDLANMTLNTAMSLVIDMPEVFLAWRDTQDFVRKVRQNMTSVGEDQPQLSFATMVKVVETVGEQFGKFQDAECKQLKASLVTVEDRGSGRVHLPDFYKPALDGSWQFQENVGYLRQLGALDESNPEEPRVMIPNYLISQTNCIASSDYYSVCCIDECEELFGHLEREIGAPEATASRIVDLISELPSSSVSAPRDLSATLRSRLEGISAEHGGSVQLHGRLFAQWMHHAYPRECPYPHVSGTTSQQTAEEWADTSGGDAVASDEELLQYTSSSKSMNTSHVEKVEDMHDLMMWSHEEELLVVRPPPAPVASFGSGVAVTGARNVLLFAVMASIVFGLVRTALSSSGEKAVPQKFLV